MRTTLTVPVRFFPRVTAALHLIVCDACGRVIGTFVPASAEEAAKDRGWRVAVGTDRCPGHAAGSAQI